MSQQRATHYAGALGIVQGAKVLAISAGWAACCSGRRATKIRERNRNTYDVEKVTCKKCIAQIARRA